MNAHKGNADSLGSLGAFTHLTNHTPGAVVSLGKDLVYYLKGCPGHGRCLSKGPNDQHRSPDSRAMLSSPPFPSGTQQLSPLVIPKEKLLSPMSAPNQQCYRPILFKKGPSSAFPMHSQRSDWIKFRVI